MNIRVFSMLIVMTALARARVHSEPVPDKSEEERLIEEYYKFSLNGDFFADSGSGSGFEPSTVPQTTVSTTTVTTTTEAPTCNSNPEFCDVTTEYCKKMDEGEVPYRCVCQPGFTNLNETGGLDCAEVKQFGGKIVLEPNTTNTKTAEDLENVETAVVDFLDGACAGLDGYDHSEVTCTLQSNGGYSCDYRSIFKAEEFENSNLNQTVVEDKIEEQINTTCSVSCEIGGLKFDQTETIESIGVIENVSELCGDSCDTTSTKCDLFPPGSYSGDYICVCKNNFTPIDGTKATCARTRCSSNFDCNDPFGTCNADADNGVGVCQCMTLFNGENCEDPWLFIFVIVMGFVVWTGLVVLLWWCCSGKKKSNKYKKQSNESEDISLENLSRKASLDNYGYTNPKSLNDIPDTGLRAQMPSLVVQQQRGSGYKNPAYSRTYDTNYTSYRG